MATGRDFLPLDIKYLTLVDWLNSRQKVLKKEYPTEFKQAIDTAQQLLQNVRYEIPSLRRQVTDNACSMGELNKRHRECMQSLASARKAYSRSCRGLTIPVDADVDTEIVASVDTELHRLFATLSASSKNLRDVVDTYISFTKDAGPQDNENGRVSVLIHVIEKGNDTVRNYKMAVGMSVPDESGAPVQMLSLPQNQSAANVEALTQEIDWDTYESATGTADRTSEPLELEVELVSEADFQQQQQYDNDDAVLRNSILEYTATRNEFLDNLFELEAFIRERSAQLRIELPLHGALISAYLPTTNETSEQLDKMALRIREVYSPLTSKPTRNLLLLHSSQKFRRSVAASIKANMQTVRRREAAVFSLEQNRDQLSRHADELQAQLLQHINNSRSLKREVEGLLSVMCNRREVNITGEIYTILKGS